MKSRSKKKEDYEHVFEKWANSNGYFTPKDKICTQQHYFIIEKVPVEYPAEMIRQYLGKYVVNPQVEKLKWERFAIYDGRVRVTHNGLKTPIKRYLYIGQNLSVAVTKRSDIAMDNCAMYCTNCGGKDHLIYLCEKECGSCHVEGHTKIKCPHKKTYIREPGSSNPKPQVPQVPKDPKTKKEECQL